MANLRTWFSDLVWSAHRLAKKWSVSCLPPGVHLLLAASRGRAYRLLRAIPPQVSDNLRRAFPHLSSEQIEEVAGRHVEFRQRLYLARVLPCLYGAGRKSRWPVDGHAELDRALERGRGVLLVTAHFGYGHAIPAALSAHGYKVSQVVAELDRAEARSERTEWLKTRSRLRRFLHSRTRVVTERLGPEDLVANLDVRPVLERLANNGILLTSGDGFRAMEFVTLRLLGQEYPFPAGLMKIAMLTQCSVLPAFAIQNGRAGKIRVEIHPSLPIDESARVDENLKPLADVLDRELRLRPHLWYRWDVEDWFRTAREWAQEGQGTRYRARLPREIFR